MQHMGASMKHWLGFMLKRFPEEDVIKEMVADLHDDEDGLLEPERHTDHSPAHSLGNMHSPTNEV
uniref:Uncharacterized protein n=1 Tax=Setaria viridis TaxID=4556 RepID=A0A4U6T533_SETVI|nr:hypothetical protein SEVIR_9G455966v2 [Setaria viridis]